MQRNESSPQRPRKRASTPRSKTGCATCKIRRLKCGEERPSCHRCVKSGWQCDGYDHVAPVSPPSDGSLSSLLPRKLSKSLSPNPLLFEPSMLLPLNEQEQQYFQNCGEEVSGQLQGEDAFFWRGIALRESITTSSVRHGLIAIGALKQSTIKKSGRYQMDAMPGIHREFALEHYQTAIQSLRESITNLRDESEIRSAMVSCIVLAIFDDFIGHRAFALQNMRNARDILLNSSSLLSTSSASGDSDNDKLVSMFIRLNVQAMCAMGIDEYHTLLPSQTLPPIFMLPQRISSYDEARRLSYVASQAGSNFFYQTAAYQLLPHQQIPQTVLDQRDHLIKQLYDLCLLLADLREDQSGALHHPLTCIKALRLHPVLLLVRLVSTYGAPQTACDALLDHFNYLVTLSREILQYELLENPDVMVAETYSAEIRTVSPLLLVATKCRNAGLRREAITLLLSSHRREWMCDSLLSGQVGQWMMSIEEEGIDTSGYIPEHARAWGESVELDLEGQNGRKAKARCRLNFKSKVTGKTETRWREKIICW